MAMTEAKIKKLNWRNGVIYGVSTGVTVAISTIFFLFLKKYTDSIGITLLVVSLIICVVAVLYFVSRWVLSEKVSGPIRDNFDELSAVVDRYSSGEDVRLDLRKAVGQAFSTARSIGPLVWYVLVASSLMGSVLVIIGLLNAAVIYQQTDRINDQTSVMRVQFLVEAQNGLASIDQSVVNINRGTRNLRRTRMSTQDLIDVVAEIDGVAIDNDGNIQLCVNNPNYCAAPISVLRPDIDSTDSSVAAFAIVMRINSFLDFLATDSMLYFPYELVPNNDDGVLTSRMGSNRFEDHEYEFVVNNFTQVLEVGVIACTGSNNSEFLVMRNAMIELRWGLKNDMTPDEGGQNISQDLIEYFGYSTADLRGTVPEADFRPDVTFNDIARSLSIYIAKTNELADELISQCDLEELTLLDIRANIVEERKNYTGQRPTETTH
ncbi:MAG: hypothetical protein GQ535_00175 [Rhodobacteraceae bacterium]|nr:hypothetical protein [Paracoccaceae bacterium]